MMEFDTENKDDQMVRFPYEEPSLKKYGDMKCLTLGSGSGGNDTFSQARSGADQTPNKEDTGPESDRAKYDFGRDPTTPGKD